MQAKIEKINMDKLDINEQLSILLRGNFMNQNHLSCVLQIDDLVEVEIILLRITSTFKGVICAAYHDDDKTFKLLEDQLKAAVCDLIKFIEIAKNYGKDLFTQGDDKNEH